MKRLMKIVLGLSIGAAVAMLFAPKSGRELRERLMGGATGRLLPAAPVEFPEPEGERLWDAGTATAVAEPPLVEPAFEEPAIVEETIVVEEPVVEETVAVEPEAAEEVIAPEPEIAEEPTSEDLRARIEETRAAVETDIAQPFGPVVAEVLVDEAVVEEAAAEDSVIEEPALEGPEFQEPIAPPEPDVIVEAPAEEPRAWEVSYEEAETPDLEEPQAEALVDEPVEDIAVAAVEEVVVEEVPAEEPVAEEVVVEEVVVEELPAEEPVAEVAEEQAAEEPVVEEPAQREGGAIDQAEMRRRIEETRARLKAKAFDAMMSGESALLSRDSGEKPVPKADDVKLDGELESTIDESLSQEEY
ncbi:MAG TPA: hypothetical protein VIL79_02080 [Thermoleophilia bacterium]